MQNIIDKIVKTSKNTEFDFREFAFPSDELSYLFGQWVDYYKMKYAICKVLKPKSILEVGVRYGYSAITFLKASSHASYLGIDNNSSTYGGSTGAFYWAKRITKGYKAEFVIADTQELKSFPGDRYDLIHIDGQQDGDSTMHDLEMALEKGKYILVDGYFWSRENMLSATHFMEKYRKLIEYAVIIPGYAGDLLIRSKDVAKNIFIEKKRGYFQLKQYYDSEYYLTDCGGYDIFTKTGGMELDQRLSSVYALANPLAGENILDIGCGRGELAFALSKSGARVTGLDYSKDAIEIAKATYSEHLGEKLEFIASDILEYNPEKKFDKIIASDIVEHIEQTMLDQMFTKLSALLKDNGCVIIHTYPNVLNYKYGYLRKRKYASLAGSYIPANPRSFYEDFMHINEQSPASLNRSLTKVFKNTLTWVSSLPDISGSMAGDYKKSDYMMASSIFSIASNEKIDSKDVSALITQHPLDIKDISAELETAENTLELSPSQVTRLPITVRNTSKARITSFSPNPINLSYHWLDQNGDLHVFDGLRTSFNIPVLAGKVLSTYITIQAPQQPGKYTLQITLVQEGCFWFENHIEKLPIKINAIVI